MCSLLLGLSLLSLSSSRFCRSPNIATETFTRNLIQSMKYIMLHDETFTNGVFRTFVANFVWAQLLVNRRIYRFTTLLICLWYIETRRCSVIENDAVRFIVHNRTLLKCSFLYWNDANVCRINIGAGLYLNVSSTAVRLKITKTKRGSGALS